MKVIKIDDYPDQTSLENETTEEVIASGDATLLDIDVFLYLG